MSLELWTSGELYDVLRDDRMDPIPSWWLDTFFTETHYSDDKEILFANLPMADRRLAPFVLPTEQGKPIFRTKGEKVKSFLPPYIKPKDAVRAVDARNLRPSEVMPGGQRLTLQERFDARVIEVIDYHRRSIKIREAFMASKAIIDGKISVKYDRDQGAAFPEVTIDFGRDPNLTVVLAGANWNDPAYDIIGDLNAWSALMYGAERGGLPVRLVLGFQAAAAFMKNEGIKELLNTDYRGGEGTSFKRGLLNINDPMTHLGTLSGTNQSLEVWTFRDQVEDEDGNLIEILDPKDAVLIAPGTRGVRCYGAIYDAEAMQEPTPIDIFPKMWISKDPGDVWLMHQSSPLPVNIEPNKTLKATVV
ncbi:major capsid protein [Roseibium sediminis]|uniref:major capsid protein n=1 Tax=Roseibium sediminis TaxID=1775174 RepID=UPI00123D4B8C|nr:major capsid protein [Roseibium sediminis]